MTGQEADMGWGDAPPLAAVSAARTAGVVNPLGRAPLTGAQRVRLSRQRRRADQRRVEVVVPAGWPVAAIKLMARLLTRAVAQDKAGATRRPLAHIRARLRRFYLILRDEEVGRCR